MEVEEQPTGEVYKYTHLMVWEHSSEAWEILHSVGTWFGES